MANIAPFKTCLSTCFENVISATPTDPRRFGTLQDARPKPKRHHGNSLINLVLDGIPAGTAILIFGPPGIGKSTYVAAAAAEYVEATNGTLYWLDADQAGDSRRILDVFERLATPTNRVQKVHFPPDEPWLDTLRAIPNRPTDCVVIDTLQSFCPEPQALCRLVLRRKYITFLIARVNKAGDFEGRKDIEHAVDASVLLDDAEASIPTKCRWVPTPRSVKRPPFLPT